MAYSLIRYTGNGSNRDYTFSFPYLNQSHIVVRLDGVVTSSFTFLSANTIQMTTAPANGVLVEIRRVTPRDTPIVDFQDGSVLLERDLDLLAKFNLYVSQEVDDSVSEGLFTGPDGQFSAQNVRITNMAEPVFSQDAATKNYVDNGVASSVSLAEAAAAQAVAAAQQAEAAVSNFTVSTEDPSGGVDGDIWFKVTI